MLAVLAGTARVEAEGELYQADAGEALLVRAGVEYTMATDDGSVAVPILMPADRSASAPAPVTSIAVTPAWQDRLIYELVRNLGYLHGDATEDRALRELAAVAGSAADAGESILPPALPHSPETIQVAHAVLRAPESPERPAQHAARVGISERTLQRRFTAETGLSFTAWRTHARIAAGAQHLADGRDVGWAATQVGFSTASSFTRAFREHCGDTPGRYRARHHATPAAPEPELTDALLSPVPGPAPSWPANETWPRINSSHVAVWVYRGRARAEIADRVFTLRRGEAVILPAGVSTRVYVDRGSLLLPLGFRAAPGVPVHLDRLATTVFSPADELFLLHGVVATYTPLRPSGHRVTDLFDEVAARTVGRGGRETRTTVAALTARLAADPCDTSGLDEWAQRLGTSPADLRRDFRAETGTTLNRWRALVRMTHAREQLTLGIPPGVVARNLGYAHPPAFTRAFRAVHGVGPQEFLTDEAARTASAEWRTCDPARFAGGRKKRPEAPILLRK